jgi:hypothetical protein
VRQNGDRLIDRRPTGRRAATGGHVGPVEVGYPVQGRGQQGPPRPVVVAARARGQFGPRVDRPMGQRPKSVASQHVDGRVGEQGPAIRVTVLHRIMLQV